MFHLIDLFQYYVYFVILVVVNFDIDVCGLYLYLDTHVLMLTYQLFDFVNDSEYDSIISY